MQRSDDLYLIDIIESANEISELTHGETFESFINDSRMRSAVAWQLATLSEACVRLSPQTRHCFNQVPWEQIKGFRNRLVHGYFELEWKTIWRIVEEEIPLLGMESNRVLREIFPNTHRTLEERRKRKQSGDE